jgi:hypothetical protein
MIVTTRGTRASPERNEPIAQYTSRALANHIIMRQAEAL